MKRTIASLAAVLIATMASAQPATTIFEPSPAAISSKSSGDKAPYAYINPYGVGPNNDSR